MRMVMALARSRASFLTSWSSLRSWRVSWTLATMLLGDFLVALKELQEFLAHAIDQVGADFGVAELVLGLGLEDRVLEPDGHGADHALAHVIAVELLAGVFAHGLEQALAEGAEVGAAVGGVLAVDERVEGLAVAAVAVGETELEGLFRVMQRRVYRLAAVRLQVLHDQVQEAVAGLEDLAVEQKPEPRVEVAVMPQAPLDVLRLKLDLRRRSPGPARSGSACRPARWSCRASRL